MGRVKKQKQREMKEWIKKKIFNIFRKQLMNEFAILFPPQIIKQDVEIEHLKHEIEIHCLDHHREEIIDNARRYMWREISKRIKTDIVKDRFNGGMDTIVLSIKIVK